MPFSLVSNATIIARNAAALYNFKAGSATMASLVTQYNTGGDALLNAIYANSVGSAKTTDVAASLVTNLGITDAAAAKTATDYIVAVLNTATAATRGAVVNQVLSSFAGLAGSTDSTLTAISAAATAWNTKVDAAVTYAGTAANTDTTFTAAALTTPTTFTLTVSADNFAGGTAADSFIARTINNANTLQDGDKVDGGAGADTLYADLVNTLVPITPVLTNMETVAIRAQNTTTDSANGNNITGNVQIDAQRSLAVDSANVVTASTGVTRWESNNSRSDVIVEDVRIGTSQKTSDVTIAFVESDPGNVDFGVYFNQQSLRNAGTSNTSLTLQVMDMISVKASGPALQDFPYDGFTFIATPTGGGTATTVKLQSQAIQDAKTYAELAKAMQDAVDAGPYKGAITVAATGSFSVDYLNTTLTGTNVVLTASGAYTITAPVTTPATTGWSASTIVGATSGLHTALASGSAGTVELVTSKVVLDDVGLGSTGGDLVIGGMSDGDTSTSRGVERFEITVGDHSKLQTINSTNNALREVTIISGTTSNNVIDAYSNTAAPANAGNLTVNGNALGQALVTGSNLALPGVENNSPAGIHHGVGAAGFTDVRLIDGSTGTGMAGKLAFTAAITTDSLTKYVNLIDTQPSPTGDVAGAGNVNFNVPGANFIYTGGSNNDTMVVSIDGAVTASRSNVKSGQSDFTFSIDGGAGDDQITVSVVNPSTTTGLPGAPANWYSNQNLNDNITIAGGAGNDIIRKPGAGDSKIDAGAGNDVVYTENTGVQASTVTTGAASTTVNGNAVWVFNTSDQVNAAPTLAARDLFNLRSDLNDTYNLYNAGLTVTYLGLPSVAVNLANTTTYKTTDLEINQAIKNAIINDPVLKYLLVAQDGPANSLVVTSLTDGVAVAGDLTVAITVPTVALTGTDLTGAAAAYGLAAGSTSAAVVAAMTTSLGAYTTKGDYVAALAQDQAGVNLTGANSTRISDNFVTPGAGDDVVVLGTTTGATTDTSSNEVIVFGAGFSGLTGTSRDVIVNFDIAGAGVDHLDMSTWVGKTPTLGAALALAGNSVTIQAAPATAYTDATLTTAFKALDTATSTASATQVYISVDSHNVGTVYSVVNGTAAADVVATAQGRIDMADVAWGTLTAANFAVPTALAEGLTAGAGVVVVPPAGGGGALAVAVAATNGAVNNDATLGAVTYTIAAPAASYTYNITGFAAGDKLVFAAGSAFSITNVSATDGIIDVVGTLGVASVTIHLVGVAVAQDTAFNATTFNTAFGAGSLA